MTTRVFPQYLMIVNDKPYFMPFNVAAAQYDSGWDKVEFGDIVIMNSDLECRKMDNNDQRKISIAADEYSGNK